jgi:MFS family permease
LAAGQDSHNQGTEEDRRHALDAIADFTKLLITLATGTVVLSATFLEKFYKGHSLTLLIASWAVIGLSVALGVIAFGQYISQLAESELKPRRSAVEGWNLAQLIAFGAGVVLFAIFAVQNVTS